MACRYQKIKVTVQSQPHRQSRIHDRCPYIYYIYRKRSLCLPQRKCCKRLAPMAGYCAHRTEIFHDGSYTDCCSRARRTPDERYTESGFEHAPHAENKQSGA